MDDLSSKQCKAMFGLGKKDAVQFYLPFNMKIEHFKNANLSMYGQVKIQFRQEIHVSGKFRLKF